MTTHHGAATDRLRLGQRVTIGPACVNTDMIGTSGTVTTATPDGSAWVQLDSGHYWLLDAYELEPTRPDTPTIQHATD